MDLQKLKEEQITLSKRLNIKDVIKLENIRFVGGIDLTYVDIWKNPTMGIACVAVYDLKKKEIVDAYFAEKEVYFPYIPTFLAYRELPLVLEVFKKIKKRVDAFLLDGMGIMHPRRMGIAAHFGVLTNTVSVGCAKSFLIGDYKEPKNVQFSYEDVRVNGELVGYVLRAKKNAKPIFVSPGNNISFISALKLVVNSIDGYKIPQPIRFAHNFLQNYRRDLLKSH